MAVEPFLGTTAQRAFIISIIVQATIVFVMVAIAFGLVIHNVNTSDPRYKTLPCYFSLFALAELFELAMALDALKLRNIIQLVGILAFHVALVVMAALQVHEVRTALVFLPDTLCPAFNLQFIGCDGPGTLFRKVEPFLIVVPCIISVAWLVLIFYVRELFGEFGWAVFHVIGADPAKKTMYQWYQILICLLKFDFFFFVGVTMQLLIVVLQEDTAEFGLTVAAIPIVLTLLIGAGIAVKREIKWLMTVSLILMLAAETYFIFKLVRFYEPSTRNQYATTRATLTTFTIVAFAILFSTFAVGLRCFADFDKGLVQAKTRDVPNKVKYAPSSEKQDPERQDGYAGGTGLTQRISIE